MGPHRKVRTLSLRSKFDDPFPYVAPVFTPVMHFQRECLNTTGPIAAVSGY